jgi:RHH-type proline utilization regulon transcriptional repressor/proline dehydrogenase/delta 1-pyrroline-5-carboxylate dehydrogenase
MASWNSPYSHPVACIIAELLAGNVVIFKPAPQSVSVGRLVVEAFWSAGIPKDVLQFVPILPNEIGQKLIVNEKLKGAILSAPYEMGQKFLDLRPNYNLQTLTKGKNTVVISATADLDQAVRGLVQSAFSYSGQKDHSVNLAIVEASVYDNPAFFRKLRDAVGSLKVGVATQPSSVITPLIQEPEANNLVALTELDAGEEWLLKPDATPGNPNLWSPGIRIGVKPGSWFHRASYSAPVLGIVRAENLDDADEIQNATPMLLSASFYSMDEREIARWKDKAQAGALFINKPNLVKINRQSSGLWKKASIGAEIRLGSLNSLVPLCQWTEQKLPTQTTLPHAKIKQLVEKLCSLLPDQAKRLRAAAGSQSKWWHEEFGTEAETAQVFGEKNTKRYLPQNRVILRANSGLANDDIAIVILASKLAGSELEISIEKNRTWLSFCPEESITLLVETEEEFQARFAQLAEHGYQVRYPHCPVETLKKSEEEAVNLLDFPILANGRIELLHYLNEQSISEIVHRFGNIIPAPKMSQI